MTRELAIFAFVALLSSVPLGCQENQSPGDNTATLLKKLSACTHRILHNYYSSEDPESRVTKMVHLNAQNTVAVTLHVGRVQSQNCTLRSRLIRRRGFHKFMRCEALLFPLVSTTSKGHSEFVGFTSSLECVNSNPDFVVVFAGDGSAQVRPRSFAKLPDVAWFSAPSIFIFVFYNKYVHMLSLVHERRHLEIAGHLLTMDNMKDLHAQAHKDLQGSRIFAFVMESTEENCLMPKMDYVGPRNHPVCVLKELQVTFNFTPVFREGYYTHVLPKGYLSMVLGDFYFYDVHDQRLSPWSRKMRYSWMTVGEKFVYYKILQVTDREYSNVSAVWSAFTPTTWLSCAFACASVTVILWWEFRSTHKTERLDTIAILTLALLIEKFELPRKFKQTLTRKRLYLICAWAQVAAFVGGIYKANLYSVFTSSTGPAPPENMKELSRSALPIFSSTHFIEPINGSKVSLMHFALTVKDKSKMKPVFAKTVNRLRRKLNFIAETAFERMMRQKTEEFPANEKLPPEYILIESAADVKAQLHLSKLAGILSHKNQARVGNEIPFLMRRMPLLVQANFFAPILTNGVERLAEAGIWDWWDKQYVARTIVKESKRMDPLWRQVGLKFHSKLRSIWGALFAVQSSRVGDEAIPLCLRTLEGAVWVYILGTVLASLGLIIEHALRAFSHIKLRVLSKRAMWCTVKLN